MPIGFYQAGYWNLGLVQSANGTTFLAALRTYLKSVDSLSALSDVYLRRTGDSPVFPYLIVSPINETPDLNTSGFYQEEKEVQFTVLANDDVAAETLGKAAYDALKPDAANPLLTWDDGNETVRLPLYSGRLRPEPGRDDYDRAVWSYTFGYRWLTVRAR